jgi:hypothetical protein
MSHLHHQPVPQQPSCPLPHSLNSISLLFPLYYTILQNEPTPSPPSLHPFLQNEPNNLSLPYPLTSIFPFCKTNPPHPLRLPCQQCLSCKSNPIVTKSSFCKTNPSQKVRPRNFFRGIFANQTQFSSNRHFANQTHPLNLALGIRHLAFKTQQ